MFSCSFGLWLKFSSVKSDEILGKWRNFLPTKLFTDEVFASKVTYYYIYILLFTNNFVLESSIHCGIITALYISVEAYRACIVTFFVRSKNLKIDRNYYPCSFRTNQDTAHFLHIFGLAFVILILNLNLNFAVLKLLKLLVDAVESNPGPTTYNLLKVVQGFFHQGDPKFGPRSNVLQCGIHMIWTMF